MKVTAAASLCALIVLLSSASAQAQDHEYINVTTAGQGKPARGESIKDTWDIDCKVDELLGLRYCFIRSVMESAKYVAARSALTVRVNSDGSTYVWVGNGETNTGGRQILKIDENELFDFETDKALAENASGILNQLQNGKILRGRWYEKPSQKQHDETLSLVGFGHALEIARAIVEKRTIPLDPNLASETAWRWGKMAGWLLRSMNPEFNEIERLARSITDPEGAEKCPQLEEARAEVEEVRATLKSPYRESFVSGYTVGVGQKAGLALTAKECEDALYSLRLRLGNFALLPQPPNAPSD